MSTTSPVAPNGPSTRVGDDFKTVKFHYADTSSMNLKGISDAAFGS